MRTAAHSSLQDAGGENKLYPRGMSQEDHWLMSFRATNLVKMQGDDYGMGS